jgi:hypothetical protein
LTNGGVFKSVDAGASWTDFLVGFVASLVIDHSSSETLYAASGRVLKSTNGGESWAYESTGLNDGYYSVHSLVIDPSAPYPTPALRRHCFRAATAGQLDGHQRRPDRPGQLRPGRLYPCINAWRLTERAPGCVRQPMVTSHYQTSRALEDLGGQRHQGALSSTKATVWSSEPDNQGVDQQRPLRPTAAEQEAAVARRADAVAVEQLDG